MERLGEKFPNPEDTTVEEVTGWLARELGIMGMEGREIDEIITKLNEAKDIQELGHMIYMYAQRDSGEFNLFEIIMQKLYTEFPDPTAISTDDVLIFIRDTAREMGVSDDELAPIMILLGKARSVEELGGMIHQLYMKQSEGMSLEESAQDMMFDAVTQEFMERFQESFRSEDGRREAEQFVLDAARTKF